MGSPNVVFEKDDEVVTLRVHSRDGVVGRGWGPRRRGLASTKQFEAGGPERVCAHPVRPRSDPTVSGRKQASEQA
jgi:hypothetical protein